MHLDPTTMATPLSIYIQVIIAHCGYFRRHEKITKWHTYKDWEVDDIIV